MGVTWTLGLTALLLGTLNILTAFVGAILLGLGIDHGIHLLSRYLEERQAGLPHPTAVRAAFDETGRGVFLAGLTTALGFLGLSISGFRGFQEFGTIAAMGVALLVIAYLSVLPALLALIGPQLTRSKAPQADGPLMALARLATPGRLGKLTFVGASVALLLLTAFGAGQEFDYDFQNLDGGSPAMRALEAKLNRVAGRGHAPVIAFADNPDEALAAAQALRARSDGPDTPIDVVIAASEVVPQAQDDKQAILEDLAEELTRIPEGALSSDEERARIRALQRMSKAEPFDRDALPVEVRDQFSDPRAVLVFPRERLSDGRAVLRFAQAVENIPVPSGETVRADGEAMILADVVRMTFQEAPTVTATALALVFVAILLLMGLKSAIVCLILAVFSVTAGLGLGRLLGVQLNYMNVVIIPVLFGMSVDAGVHMVARSTFDPAGRAKALAQTGAAVLGATITTAFGFGALLAANHQGLNGMGAIALLGLAASLFAALIWLMSLFAWRSEPPSNDAQAARITLSGGGRSHLRPHFRYLRYSSKPTSAKQAATGR